jgi:hypothetical protein
VDVPVAPLRLMQCPDSVSDIHSLALVERGCPCMAAPSRDTHAWQRPCTFARPTHYSARRIIMVVSMVLQRSSTRSGVHHSSTNGKMLHRTSPHRTATATPADHRIQAAQPRSSVVGVRRRGDGWRGERSTALKKSKAKCKKKTK